jgi:hypothetical protein
MKQAEPTSIAMRENIVTDQVTSKQTRLHSQTNKTQIDLLDI